jgi:uncharacterized protein
VPDSHGRFVWYELMTTDAAAAKTFYTSVVGWDIENTSMSGATYGLFTVAKVPACGLVELPRSVRSVGAPPHWIGYVAVDDVEAAVERTRQLGGAVHVPPTDVPDISRFSIIADPQSATLALIRGLQPRDEPLPDMDRPGHVGWHELLAADWAKAMAFYGGLFGWQKSDYHTGSMGHYQEFSVKGETIGGMFTKSPTLPVPFWLYYFNIADVETTAKRIEAGGGQIIYGPTVVPGGAVIVHCADPQGAIFGLLHRQKRRAAGYFESTTSAPSGAARRRWSW